MNNAYSRIKANDDMALNAIKSGILRVDAERGEVFSSRWHKPLGSLDKEGYVIFTFHLRGRRRKLRIHRVMWLAVNGTIPEGMAPTHKNENRQDNRISNLRLTQK